MNEYSLDKMKAMLGLDEEGEAIAKEELQSMSPLKRSMMERKAKKNAKKFNRLVQSIGSKTRG